MVGWTRLICFDANVAILSNVDLDHQAYLGDTREAIGRKSWHLSPDRPAIVGRQNPPERGVFRSY